MRFWVGITDGDWFRFLAARPDTEEVNFWQPSAGRRPFDLPAGTPFLFKLHARDGGWIVGGGTLAKYSVLPIWLAWDAFGEENGAAPLDEMIARVQRYRRRAIDLHTDQIGCTVLTQPWFFERSDWIAAPPGWAPNIVQGRTSDTAEPAGLRLWRQVEEGMARSSLYGRLDESAGSGIAEGRYGSPVIVTPRLGQGAFRVLVTDAYERRCAVTGERTLPVLDAAHIRPYSKLGPHELANGLLLRTDLHTLFDAGYLTVTPSMQLRVSRRIREEYKNGRDYYALDGRELRLPVPPNPPPSLEFLEWHADTVFRH
jgi:putative restriction endonuclease